jgi:hypothetical protein
MTLFSLVSHEKMCQISDKISLFCMATIIAWKKRKKSHTLGTVLLKALKYLYHILKSDYICIKFKILKWQQHESVILWNQQNDLIYLLARFLFSQCYN